MLTDFYTRPLEGVLFKFFSDILMRYIFINKIIDDDIEMKVYVGISVENPVTRSFKNLAIYDLMIT